MSVLSLIKRRFREIDKGHFQLLYKAYVWLHMEYYIQPRLSHLVKDRVFGEGPKDGYQDGQGTGTQHAS